MIQSLPKGQKNLEREMMVVVVDLINTYIHSEEYLGAIISICKNRAAVDELDDEEPYF